MGCRGPKMSELGLILTKTSIDIPVAASSEDICLALGEHQPGSVLSWNLMWTLTLVAASSNNSHKDGRQSADKPCKHQLDSTRASSEWLCLWTVINNCLWKLWLFIYIANQHTHFSSGLNAQNKSINSQPSRSIICQYNVRTTRIIMVCLFHSSMFGISTVGWLHNL